MYYLNTSTSSCTELLVLSISISTRNNFKYSCNQDCTVPVSQLCNRFLKSHICGATTP